MPSTIARHSALCMKFPRHTAFHLDPRALPLPFRFSWPSSRRQAFRDAKELLAVACWRFCPETSQTKVANLPFATPCTHWSVFQARKPLQHLAKRPIGRRFAGETSPSRGDSLRASVGVHHHRRPLAPHPELPKLIGHRTAVPRPLPLVLSTARHPFQHPNPAEPS